MTEPIIVKRSIKSNIMGVLMALLMLAASVFLLSLDFKGHKGLWGVFSQNQIFYGFFKGSAVIGIIFSLVAFIVIMINIKDTKTVLMVDDKGITISISDKIFNLIPWKDINRVYIGNIMGNKIIEVEVNNQDEYMEKLTKKEQAVILMNKKLGHEMVIISLDGTCISPNTLLPQIQDMLHQSRQS